MVTASKDGTARVWDTHTGNTLLHLTANLGSADLMTIHELGHSLNPPAASTSPSRAYASVAQAPQLSGNAVAVNSAVFSDNGEYIVTTSGKNAYLWQAKSPATWTELTESSPTTLQGHTDTVTKAAFSPNGK